MGHSPSFFSISWSIRAIWSHLVASKWVTVHRFLAFLGQFELFGAYILFTIHCEWPKPPLDVGPRRLVADTMLSTGTLTVNPTKC